MATPAKAFSHRRYAKVKFNWAEQYALTSVDTYAINPKLYGWILNRPGANVESLDIAADIPTANPAATGSYGVNHQPYLWDQIQADFDEYKIYGCQYTLTVSNCTTDNTAVTNSQINVAVGVTQERYESGGPTFEESMSVDHVANQAVYMEGRHPEWQRRTIGPGETAVFKGYVNIPRLLKASKYNNRNDCLQQYPWYEARSSITEQAIIGDNNQCQPYYGWSPAQIANIEEDSDINAVWVTADYARAPQCAFLYLFAAAESTQTTNPPLRFSLSLTQYVKFKRGDPQYGQS